MRLRFMKQPREVTRLTSLLSCYILAVINVIKHSCSAVFILHPQCAKYDATTINQKSFSQRTARVHFPMSWMHKKCSPLIILDLTWGLKSCYCRYYFRRLLCSCRWQQLWRWSDRLPRGRWILRLWKKY